MPAYNAEKTLEKTYNEIYQNFVDEVILVDDFSNDDTKEIAKPNFDLAIRQFVTSVNGENVEESREPKMTNEEINKLVLGEASLDGGTTAEIQTVQFGRVKIYIKDTCATITIGTYKYSAGNH